MVLVRAYRRLGMDLGALALLASVLICASAAPPLPPWPEPGQRPPGVMKSYLGSLDLLACEYDPPTAFDQRELLQKLYGRHFDATAASGAGNIVVLGAHNSGTSMVTRLIMLMGAFGGNFETISIHRHNKLKYYEQFAVSLFHDAFLGKFVDTRFRPYHGQNLNFSSMTSDDRANLDCFARKQIQDMERHKPWVMKDPRMALAMPLWRPYIPNLVCVLVHKDPVANSISLASNGKKSSQTGESDMMSPQRWLNLWGTTVMQGLEGCRGAPTVVFDSRTILSDVDGALATLKNSLEHAGVVGLTLPDADEVAAEVKAFIRTGPRQYSVNAMNQKKLGLSEHPDVDTTPPQMSPQQAAMAEAINHFIQRADADAALPASDVADQLLSLAASIEQEQMNRHGDASGAAADGLPSSGLAGAGGLPGSSGSSVWAGDASVSATGIAHSAYADHSSTSGNMLATGSGDFSAGDMRFRGPGD